MELMVLSGGSGKRLYPLSNDARPKQFLKVLRSPTNGELESMVQRLNRNLKDAGLSSKTTLVVNRTQTDILSNQLGGDLASIVQPAIRDTLPVILLSTAYLYSEKKVDLDEVVTFMPVDSAVQPEFFEAVRAMESRVRANPDHLILMGVRPTYPTSKYGYIIPYDNVDPSCAHVQRFVEKPEEALAKRLIEDGALWNCAVVSTTLRHLVELFASRGYSLNYQEVLSNYHSMEPSNFFSEIVETEYRVLVTPYENVWNDIGTWNALADEMQDQTLGDVTVSETSSNVTVINELDIPLTVLGLSDAVVVAGREGILVSTKDQVENLKNYLPADTRPMFEERRWGWYKVLEHSKVTNTYEVLTKHILIEAGKNLSYQLHHKRSEVWTIIAGEGEFILDDKLMNVKPGDILSIPVGSKHGIRALTDIEFIEVQTGTDLVEEDIIRLAMSWEEALTMISAKAK